MGNRRKVGIFCATAFASGLVIAGTPLALAVPPTATPTPTPRGVLVPTPSPAATPNERGAEEQQRVTVYLRVIGAGTELWAGDLVLDGYRGAQLTQGLEQADVKCADLNSRSAPSQRTGLNFRLNYSGRRTDEPFGLNISWTRQSTDCSLPGTRTVGMDVRVDLDPGEKRVIEGDGGLRIELQRR